MGLDMYACITHQHPNQPVDFTVTDYTEIHYWRKHADLHGWMADLYFAKAGNNPDFNCATVTLTIHELNQLETAVRTGSLPKTSGFFFGESFGDELDGDLEFIVKAKQAIDEGYTVFYDSWW